MNFLLSTTLPVAERLFNTALDMDPLSAAKLHRIGPGKRLLINCSGPVPVRVWLETGEGRLRLLSASEDAADCTLSGDARALLTLLVGDSRSALQSGRLSLAGDTALAQDLQRLLRDLDVDWQDHLAPLIGDLPTWQLQRQGQRAAAQWRRSADRVHNTIEEFLHEESGWFPAPEEITQFQDHLEALRLQMDRLEARSHQLRQRLARSATN